MGLVFLATLGQRPEAITVAFDCLREEYAYEGFGLLHTNAQASGIAEAFSALNQVLSRDYPFLKPRYHEVTLANGDPLLDLDTAANATAYFQGVLRVLHEYKQAGRHLHLLVSGGRKAMSIYAMLAAARVFNPPHDKVWAVLSDERLLAKEGQFHVPAGMKGLAQVVDLPITPARWLPNTDLETLMSAPRSNRETFLGKLTPEERKVAECLARHPDWSNERIGGLLNKSARTVERQFTEIYGTMVAFFDNGAELDSNKKRIMLIQILGEK